MTLLQHVFAGDPNLLRGVGLALGSLSVNLVVALLILAGTVWASNWAAELSRRCIRRLHRRTSPDPTLESFGSSLIRYLVAAIGLIAMLQQVGVRTTSIIAVLGAASLAVGLALQGALANVAAGVMLLLFRPYRVGDDIEIGGRRGVVKALDLFVTELATPDNLRIMAPNGKVFGDFILNYTVYRTRRADIAFRIYFNDDVARAIGVLAGVAAADARVLAEPPATAAATEIGDSWTVVVVQAWTARENYAAVKSALIVRGAAALRAKGFAPAFVPPAPAEPTAAAEPRLSNPQRV